jgi:hypothetical protein
VAGREGAPSGYTVRPQHHIEKVIPERAAFRISLQENAQKEAGKDQQDGQADGKPRKVGDGRSWIDVLLGTGKRK